MNYKLFLAILLVLSKFTSNAQLPLAAWGHAIGDGQGGLSRINDLVIDEDGNTYVVGTLRRLLDVIPGAETFLLSGNSTDDLWMAAYSTQNELLWAFKLGNSSTENISSIHLDQNSNLLICGFFTNTVDFDPGPGTFELTTYSASNADGFFASYSTSGQLNWAKQVGGSSVDNAQDFTTDNNGNILITGNFSGTADFDPSSQTATETATGSFNDIFVAKYTNSGDYIWSFSLEGSSVPDNGQCLTVRSDNSFVLGAIYQGDLDADPGAGVAILPHANNYDALIGCYSADGDYLWAGQYGLNGDDRVNSIAIDNQDNIYVGGYFNQTVDFDFSGSVAGATSVGNDDACLISYDANGNLIWFKTWGSTSADEIQSVAVNESGSLVVTGGFNGTVDFNPDAAAFELTAQSTDLFISVFDTNGEFQNAVNIGGSAYDFGNAVLINNNNAVVGGLFATTTNFDPLFSDTSRTVGTQTAFFAAYDLNNLQLQNLAAMQDRDGSDDNVYGMVTDDLGNVYVCGSFQGSAFFANNSQEYQSADETDAFVAKYSPSGTPLFIYTFGGSGADIAKDIILDAEGNIYATGSFEQDMDFIPGAGSLLLNSVGNSDVFLIKLDNSGNLIWANSFGGGSDESGDDLTINNNGDLILTGYFRATVDFDPGPDATELSASVRDCFIASYTSSDCSFNWVKQISGSSNEYGVVVQCDEQNSVYLAGYFAGQIDADPGVGTFSLSSNGSNDAFVIKLDENADFIWAFSFGGSSSDQIADLIINQNNELLIGGYFQNSFDANPGQDEELLTSEGQTDIFLIKFSNQPDLMTGIPQLDWAHGFGSTGSDFLFDMDIRNGLIYFSGNMADTINFDVNGDPAGIIGSEFSSVGYYTVLNEDASFVEAYNFVGLGQTFFYNINAIQNGLFISGTVSGALDIQPGPAVNIVQNYGNLDGIVFKLGDGEPCEPSASEIAETACEVFTLNGINYTQSGQFIQTLINATGCDSTITLNLQILEASSATLDESSCEAYTLNGETYTSSGVYTQTLMNAEGCDSTITLNLQILESSSATLDESSCGAYTLNGEKYTSSGVYTQTLMNAAGCDSILTLNLTVSQFPDLSITENGNVLTANQDNAIYQWIDCNTNEEIDGETQQVFEAGSAGSYAVIITNGACSDTSECVVLSTVHLIDNLNEALFNLYPNPASSQVQLILPQQTQNARLTIYSADGRLCISKVITENINPFLIDVNMLNAGTYIVSVQSKTAVYTQNLIILDN